MARLRISCLIYLLLALACTDKPFDLENPEASYIIAKEPYDDENFEIALSKLGEFKARFPYSQYAIEAELLIADCHYQLGHYADAAAGYSQFITLHPKHAKVAYAQFRVGESYWADAPEEIDREQDLTAKAVKEWELLLKKYPASEYDQKTKALIATGKRRMAEAHVFIASFYCKQELWDACAYRYAQLADQGALEFRDLLKVALNEAAKAFEKLAEQKTEENKDANLYFRKMSQAEMRKRGELLRAQAKKIKV